MLKLINWAKKPLMGALVTFVTLSWIVTPVLATSSVSETQEKLLVKKEVSQKLAYEHRGNVMLVRFKDGVSKSQMNKVHEAAGPARVQALGETRGGRKMPKWVTDSPLNDVQLVTVGRGDMTDVMTTYALAEEVKYVEPVYEMRSTWTDTGTETYSDDFDQTPAPSTGYHWMYDKINLPEVWDRQNCAGGGMYCGGDSNIVVAVIDTGVGYESYTATYEAYGDNYGPISYGQASELSNVNLWTNPSEVAGDNNDNDGNDICDDVHGVDMYMYLENMDYYGMGTQDRDPALDNPCNTDDLRKEGHANDDYGHGTYVASIIASNTNNATGSISAAHNVKILPLKVNDAFVDTMYELEIAFSVSYAAQYAGADVINMSLGGFPYSEFMEDIINDAVASGSVVVAASGNSNTTVSYPAAYDNVIAVGSVNPDDSRSSYSNYGADLDMVAPAGDTGTEGQAMWQETLDCMGSCTGSSDFTAYSTRLGVGTSYSSPQVAAAAALILSEEPNLRPEQVRSVLASTARDVNTVGWDNETGEGVLDLDAIYNMFSLSESHYFTWYDTTNDAKSWVLVGNSSTTETATVSMKIGNSVYEQFEVPPGGRVTPKWSNVKDGPVVVSTDSPNIIYASQRTVFDGHFNEYPGIELSSLTTDYYFTWYDSMGSNKAWILIGNPSTTTMANVTLKIGSSVNESYSIPPGGKITPSFSDVLDGPVEVTSDINVYATQRSLYKGSFNENAGIPSNQLTNQYYFTWYDMKSPNAAWVLVGNPSTTQTASVNIKIGANVSEDYTIPPGENITPKFVGVLDGPVEVTSDINVYATQRAVINSSFSEYAGIPANQLASEYYFTWYDTQNSNSAWILVGNPSTTTTANVSIKIGSNDAQSYTIEPGGRITPKIMGLLDGPVVVNSDINVYTTQRALYNGTFNEYIGIR